MASSHPNTRSGIEQSQALRIARELQLETSGMRPVFLHGPTMRPLLRDGDLLEIESIDFESVRVGDIVTFRDADRFPTRRVVGLDAEALTVELQADFTPSGILVVDASALLGRVVARIRKGRRLSASSIAWRCVAWSAPLRTRLLHEWRRRFR